MNRIIKKLLSYLPRKFPQTLQELESLISDVLASAGLPAEGGNRRAVLTQIMHLDSDTRFISVASFSRALQRSICNQLSFNLIQKINDDEKEQREKRLQEAAGEVVQETKV